MHKILRKSKKLFARKQSKKLAPGLEEPQFKAQTRSKPQLLAPLTLRCTASDGKLYYIPDCSVCGYPISDFRMGNLIPRRAIQSCAPEGEEMVAVHKECDHDPHPRRNPWISLDCILQMDQRPSFDKRLEKENHNENHITNAE
jgi:hypothetical protein